jgi:hypothetical protein
MNSLVRSRNIPPRQNCANPGAFLPRGVPWDSRTGWPMQLAKQVGRRSKTHSFRTWYRAVESMLTHFPGRKSCIHNVLRKQRGSPSDSMLRLNRLRLATQVFVGRFVLIPAAHCTLVIAGATFPLGPAKLRKHLRSPRCLTRGADQGLQSPGKLGRTARLPSKIKGSLARKAARV